MSSSSGPGLVVHPRHLGSKGWGPCALAEVAAIRGRARKTQFSLVLLQCSEKGSTQVRVRVCVCVCTRACTRTHAHAM